MSGIKVKKEKNCVNIYLAVPKGLTPNESEAIEISRSGVRGLLKPKYEKHAFSSGFSYVATPSVSLNEFLQRPISKPDFLFVMGQLTAMPKKLSVKRISETKVLFDLGSIFINETTRELQFLYLPADGFRVVTDFKKLLLEFLCAAEPSDKASEKSIQSLTAGISAFNSRNFSIAAVENLLRREDTTISSMISTMNGGQSGYLTSDRLDALNHADGMAGIGGRQFNAEDYSSDEEDIVTDALSEVDSGSFTMMPPEQDSDYSNDYCFDEDRPTDLLIKEEQKKYPWEDEATGLLEEDEETGLLEEEEATGLLEEDDATGLLAEEEEPTGLLTGEESEDYSDEDPDTYVLPTEQPYDESDADGGNDVKNKEQNQKEKPKKFFSVIDRLKHNQSSSGSSTKNGKKPENGNNQADTADEEDTAHFPTLYRLRTDERVAINKPVFRIGKERTYVDLFVSGNEAVSRSHADIILRGQRCFVRDLNSKNRTFVNDLPIKPDTEVELFDGDNLRLANEDFRFNK